MKNKFYNSIKKTYTQINNNRLTNNYQLSLVD